MVFFNVEFPLSVRELDIYTTSSRGRYLTFSDRQTLTEIFDMLKEIDMVRICLTNLVNLVLSTPYHRRKFSWKTSLGSKIGLGVRGNLSSRFQCSVLSTQR